jgi:hypothetical protein
MVELASPTNCGGVVVINERQIAQCALPHRIGNDKHRMKRSQQDRKERVSSPRYSINWPELFEQAFSAVKSSDQVVRFILLKCLFDDIGGYIQPARL